jgi:hypothetical protein
LEQFTLQTKVRRKKNANIRTARAGHLLHRGAAAGPRLPLSIGITDDMEPANTEADARIQAEGMVERILYQSRQRQDEESGAALRKLVIRQALLTRNAYIHSTTAENLEGLRAISEPRIDDINEGNLQNVLRNVASFRGVEFRSLSAGSKQYADPTLHRMGKVVQPLLTTLILERGKISAQMAINRHLFPEE